MSLTTLLLQLAWNIPATTCEPFAGAQYLFLLLVRFYFIVRTVVSDSFCPSIPIPSNRAIFFLALQDPTWNETFTTDLLRKAEVLGLTVWHDATIPPDSFVANCSIGLADLIDKEDQPLHDLWVDLEPSGRIHCKIELQWATQEEQSAPRQFKEQVSNY